MLSLEHPVVVSANVNEAEWNAYVAAHPDSTGYHLWEWRHVFEHAFGHRSEYLAARAQGGLVGVLPLVVFEHRLFGNFMVSLPFVNYGGVLATTTKAERALLDAASRLAAERGLAHVELRHRAIRFPELPVKVHKVAMRLPLASAADEAWTALDRKVRNQVRKAEKSGLTVSAGGAELLDAFYRVFSHNMRDLGTPVYDRRFFSKVLEEFPGCTRVWMVWRGGQAVAGAISYRYRGTVEVPWASSLKDYRSMCPNNLLYWHVIRQAIEDGADVFDFGRSTPGEGTYHFKLQWGARPEPLYWEYHLAGRRELPDRSPRNPKLRAAIAVWKHLPLAVAGWMGPPIVRYLP